MCGCRGWWATSDEERWESCLADDSSIAGRQEGGKRRVGAAQDVIVMKVMSMIAPGDDVDDVVFDDSSGCDFMRTKETTNAATCCCGEDEVAIRWLKCRQTLKLKKSKKDKKDGVSTRPQLLAAFRAKSKVDEKAKMRRFVRQFLFPLFCFFLSSQRFCFDFFPFFAQKINKIPLLKLLSANDAVALQPSRWERNGGWDALPRQRRGCFDFEVEETVSPQPRSATLRCNENCRSLILWGVRTPLQRR